jgi:hypothetical protein
MPTLTIKITMDNAAFDQDAMEVGRLLRLLAEDFECYGAIFDMDTKLFDLNGNTVGEAKVTR